MIEQMLKKIDIFTTIDDDRLKAVVDITYIKNFNKDNIIFYEGDEANSFYLLLDGEVKLYKTKNNTQEVVLHYFVNPTMIAEMATLENIKFPATCVATKNNTKIAIINKEKFLQMLLNDRDFSFYIIKSLTKKIKTLEATINRNLIFDATTKVCSFLKEHPNILNLYKNIQIANMLNMAPETLSRIITKLKKSGIIEQNNTIKDINKLDLFIEF